MFRHVYTVDFGNLLLNYISVGSLEPKSFAGIFLGGKKIFYETPWGYLKWHRAVEVTWLMRGLLSSSVPLPGLRLERS